MTRNNEKIRPSPWPHRWAWLLACATFPLIWVGGLVTTNDAGMAFRDWLTSDGTFFLFYDWLSAAGDKFVEHGHRLLGALAGFLSLGLAIVTWRCESRGWVRQLSLLVLASVVLQAVLGGMRVVLDERVLALIHGCTGPLFFLLCVMMVVVTSRWWKSGVTLAEKGPAAKVFRLAVLCTGLAYLQLVVGAALRHSPRMTHESAGGVFQLAVYFHLVLAALIVAYVFLLAWKCFRHRLQRVTGLALLALVAMQICLGLGSWLVKYGMPSWATRLLGERTFVNHADDGLQAALVTSHVATGSLILAASLVIALRVARQLDYGLAKLPQVRFGQGETVS
ncbi:MAG: cytochrome oxidase assembly protein [Pirellulales bacterium]|nr:cytochrome oxidase assembly protein [Pirellulales bacterium]